MINRLTTGCRDSYKAKTSCKTCPEVKGKCTQPWNKVIVDSCRDDFPNYSLVQATCRHTCSICRMHRYNHKAI